MMFLITLLDHANGPISFLIQSLIDQVDELATANSHSISDIKNIMNSLDQELIQHNDDIIRYSRKHQVTAEDYWVFCYLQQCIEYVQDSLTLLESKKLTKKELEKLKQNIYGIDGYWNNKYLDELSCWCDAGMDEKKGAALSPDVSLYNNEDPKKAFSQMLKNALVAEKYYFSLARNKKNATVVLKNSFLFNRRANKTNTIDCQESSGRSIITAWSGAVAESIQQVDQEKLISVKAIAEQTHWRLQKAKNWNRETVMRGMQGVDKPIAIKYQFQPVPGQLGNIHTSGVMRYSEQSRKGTPNILALLNELTQKKPAKEKIVATLLLQYKKGNGLAISEQSLRQSGLLSHLTNKRIKTIVPQFTRAAFLICFQEVYRRKNQGYNNKAERVLELPFGIAVACALKLIQDGHLTLSQVFNEDAYYGVFTGQQVMSTALLQTIKKFNELFSYFIEKYLPKEYGILHYYEHRDDIFPVMTPQYFHSILKESDGGESDSDDEDYNELNQSNAEDMQELEARLEDLTIRVPNMA